MAKKSAMSKGYRKTIKKKPFLTKKEIIELVVVLAVIVLAVLLFNIFYDDGFIKANKLQAGDVVSYASTDLRDRYMKIAEIGEIEGFTLDERAADESPIYAYTFRPDEEVDNVSYVTVSGSFVSAPTLVDTTLSYMSGLTEDSGVSAVQEASIQGYDAYIYAYTYSEYDEAAASEEAAPAEETETAEAPADNVFNQVVSAYIALNDTHTLCFHINRVGSDDSFYLAEDELVEFVEKYSTAFTMVAPEA